MVAYWIARSKVSNPENYNKYVSLVPDILKKYNARPLTRGGRYEIMEGTDKFHRFIVIEFPDLETAVAAYNSPEYQQAKQHRDGAGEVEIVMVEEGSSQPG